MDVACLVAGDEDLVEAVGEAQRHGVRVLLLALSGEAGTAACAEDLISEVDEVHTLPAEVTAGHLHRPTGLADPHHAGRRLAGVVLERHPRWAGSLTGWRPRLPAELDRALLGAAAHEAGSPTARLDEASRQQLRAGFWEGVDELAAG